MNSRFMNSTSTAADSSYTRQQSNSRFDQHFERGRSSYYNIEEMNYADDEPLEPQQFEPEEIDIEATTQLTMKLTRKTIRASSTQDQAFPMLVSLITGELKKSRNSSGVDLVCVLDKSGSMNVDGKIEMLKKTFTQLMNYLGSKDRLSIVTFNSDAQRLVPLMRATDENKAKIFEAVNNIKAMGGTDINLGMHHAFQILKQRRQANPITSIFLLSDGQDDGAQYKVEESLVELGVSEGVSINCFGFGADHDPELMADIADLRDGNFYFIEELETIDKTFVDCLGGLLSSIAQNVTLRIKSEEGMRISQAYGHPNMWKKEDEVYQTKLVQLMAEKNKDFILELTIGYVEGEIQQRGEIKVASAEAEFYDINGKKIVKKAELFIHLIGENEECKKEEEDDVEVMRNFYRVRGAGLTSEARKLAEDYEFDDAKQLMMNFREELLNCFLKSDEFVLNLAKDIENTMNDIEPDRFEIAGRNKMYSDFRSQMCQRSNLTSVNSYQNRIQREMLSEVDSKSK